MNRRGFLGKLLKAGAAFAILPPAVTYARQWRPSTSGLIVPSSTALIEIPRGLRYHSITLKLHHQPAGVVSWAEFVGNAKIQILGYGDDDGTGNAIPCPGCPQASNPV